MERVKGIFETLENEANESVDVNCFAVAGNKEEYSTVIVGDYDKIGESLYFAFCDDDRLLAVAADAVRIASEVFAKEEE